MESVSEQAIPCQAVTNHPAAKGKAVRWTADYEIVDTDIMLVRGALPQLDELRVKIDKHAEDFKRTTTIDDELRAVENNEWRNCDYIALNQDAPDDLLYYGLLCQSVEGPYLGTYIEKVNNHALVRTGSGYNLLRYPEGGYYRVHVDVAHDHPVLGHRRLSAVLFCNDDFEGGELVFPRQGITIKPEKGMMVIFPSGVTHPHESTTIVRGTKYAIVGWYY